MGRSLHGALPEIEVEVFRTHPRDTLRWVRRDILVRLLPFALVCSAVWLLWRPGWMGIAAGNLRFQLAIGLAGLPLMFAGSLGAQFLITARRGRIGVPAGPADAALQAAYYALNAPLEEVFFRGLLQGGLGALTAPPLGFLAATAAYVLYHRLGNWTWPDVAATALAGVPFGLVFWLAPGPASLLGVTIAHLGATCGFLGPGPYLLNGVWVWRGRAARQ